MPVSRQYSPKRPVAVSTQTQKRSFSSPTVIPSGSDAGDGSAGAGFAVSAESEPTGSRRRLHNSAAKRRAIFFFMADTSLYNSR